jgi:hypothetical protein
VVYSREIGERTFTFGVSGMLLKNALIMFDYETKSLWPIMMNRSVRGKMAGAELEVIPVARKTTWGAWKKAHPETKVLSVDGREHRPHNVYARRFARGQAGVRPIENVDRRLKALDRVIGVTLAGSHRAYPIEKIKTAGVIQEEVGEVPLVIGADLATGALGAFDRRLGDEVIRFLPAIEGDRLEDEGGSLWDIQSGVALEGPRKGKKLAPLPVRDVFWFIWADYHPETTIFEG